MTTSTVTAIIAKIKTVIEAITPSASPTSRGFARTKQPNPHLRKWAETAGANGLFRIFDVAQAESDRVDLFVQDPTATLCMVPILVTVVYPTLPELYGLTEYADLEALIASDALQIRDAIYGPGGLADGGHQMTKVTERALDKSVDGVWFKNFYCEATFYVAQRL